MNWILIIASISSLILSFYFAIREIKPKVLRRISWCISVLVVLMTVIGHWYEMKSPRLHLGLTGPHLSAAESYDHVKSHADDQNQLQLLEVIGSYYTCVRKPDDIFLQFCEWVFVFRSSESNDLVEYRVFDSRMPELPILPADALFDGMREGGFTTCVSYNIPPQALGIRNVVDQDSAVHQYDAKGRVIVKLMGKGPKHSFSEINEGPNEFVLSLTRVCARPTDQLPESTVIERWNRFGDVVIYRTTFPKNSFYERLSPIEFDIDAQEAITYALDAKAEFEVPGKRMVSTGAVRLYNGQDIDVPGPCWHLPMRMSLRPIVIQAQSGRVYFVDDDGGFTAYWSIKHYIFELVVGILFLTLLAIGLYAMRRSRSKSDIGVVSEIEKGAK